MKNIVVLTGAGVSAESGINTFRDADGLWEGHDVMQVASPQGWAADPELVLDFYNQRRRQLFEVEPNSAHKILVRLEEKYNVHIITQNVDDLHERAGSTQVLHLHGELRKVRSQKDPNYILDWEKDLYSSDTCPSSFPLRPHIVWFGEEVPLIPKAAELCATADIVIIIGTSMQVYPAAGLVDYTPDYCRIYYIDPKPATNVSPRVKVIAQKATVGTVALVEELLHS